MGFSSGPIKKTFSVNEEQSDSKPGKVVLGDIPDGNLALFLENLPNFIAGLDTVISVIEREYKEEYLEYGLSYEDTIHLYKYINYLKQNVEEFKKIVQLPLIEKIIKNHKIKL